MLARPSLARVRDVLVRLALVDCARVRLARTAAAVIAVLAVLAARPFAAATLPHLHGIDELRDWFNAGNGHVRLILLLSPT
jgi:hypothetical protein